MPGPKHGKRSLIAVLLIAATAGGAAVAQEAKDLMSSDPTAEELIEILKPKEDPDGLGSARGIRVTPRTKCTLRRPSGTRGIGLKPISEPATLRNIQFAYNSAEILPAARH